MMAVGLIAAPVMASVASAITPSSRHGAVQALLRAFSSLSEGAGPAAFGWLLASLPGGPRAALPGLPFALGVAAAALGLCLSAGAIEAAARSDSPASRWARRSWSARPPLHCRSRMRFSFYYGIRRITRYSIDVLRPSTPLHVTTQPSESDGLDESPSIAIA